MIKNTAGQHVGAQVITAADNSAFTGAVTVYVCGDAGTQAAGSVGSGACTHEGNGYHTYAPAKAETNYALVAFTFTGSGASPTTVQVYPVGGDAYTALAAGVTLADDAITASKFDESTAFPLTAADTGATAVARTGADSDTLETLSDQLDAGALEATAQSILADTNELQTVWADGGRLDTLLDTAAEDPWAVELPGAYVDSEAGYLLSDMHDRMEGQVPSGPVMVTPSTDPSQTLAWTMCYDVNGEPEVGVELQIRCVFSTMPTGTYCSDVMSVTSDANGLAAVLVPRGAGLQFEARRTHRGRYTRFQGTDGDTLPMPTLLAAS